IQEGVNLATPGGTVNVLAGTYAENVTIANALTLAGQGNVVLLAPIALSGTGVAITGNPSLVTLSDLKIQNYDLGVSSTGGTTLNLNDVTLNGNNTAGASIAGVANLNVASTAAADQTVA